METLGQEQQVPQHSHSTLSLAHSRRSLCPSRVALSRSLAHSRVAHSPNTLARSLSPNTLALASSTRIRQFRTRNRTLPLHLGFGPPPPASSSPLSDLLRFQDRLYDLQELAIHVVDVLSAIGVKSTLIIMEVIPFLVLAGFHTCVGTGGEKRTAEWYKEKGIEVLLLHLIIHFCCGKIQTTKKEMAAQGKGSRFESLAIKHSKLISDAEKDQYQSSLSAAVRELNSKNRTVFYGKYQCTGPGASTSKRAKYTKILSDGEAKPYLDKSYINAATWLLPPPKL
ncbi:hypothetical protein Syun_026121 [Stephania yunnanensis]|uniref:Uncharacterized protein n=1 Tax=Stephania yunnanensis TaxID=152371 RepID=A0AAP0HWE4_9MAGN